jgi:DNA-binding MarR family transcriptional regulator
MNVIAADNVTDKDEDRDAGTALSLCAGALAVIDAERLRTWDELGLTMSQVRFLQILSQQRGRPLRASEIAAALSVHPATITYMTDRLTGLGLVRRYVDRRDHRVKHVELTEKGRMVLRGESVIADGVLGVLHQADRSELDSAARALERVTNFRR